MGTDRDRFAVWDREEHGEVIAHGDWQVRHYLAAGTLEPPFRRQTSERAARLERAGMTATYRDWAGGHDHWWWQAQLPTALAWLLADR
jgi:enterochelin esterase-like enzyme